MGQAWMSIALDIALLLVWRRFICTLGKTNSCKLFFLWFVLHNYGVVAKYLRTQMTWCPLFQQLYFFLQCRALHKQLNHSTSLRSKYAQDLQIASENIQQLQVGIIVKVPCINHKPLWSFNLQWHCRISWLLPPLTMRDSWVRCLTTCVSSMISCSNSQTRWRFSASLK